MPPQVVSDIQSAKGLLEPIESTHIALVISHECQGDGRAIQSSMGQAFGVNFAIFGSHRRGCDEVDLLKRTGLKYTFRK
jgi:hypothetical protein